MNLYHVQDADRPMYVVAASFGDAIDRWKEVIATENNMSINEVEEPMGCEYVCGSDELLLEAKAAKD